MIRITLADMTLSLSAGSVLSRPRRSILVTVLGWLTIVANAVLVPISAVSFATVLVGGYGTANMDPLGGLVVIAGPPVTVLAGIGLLRRWWWAWSYMLVALVGVVIWNSGKIIKGPSPARSYTSADGVLNTVSAIEVDYLFHGTAILVAIGLCTFLLSRNVRSEFRIRRKPSPAVSSPVGSGPPVLPAILSQPDATKPGHSSERIPPTLPAAESSAEDARHWRVGHQGRDCMYYEEQYNGGWHRLEINGEMLMGRAHHVIYFPSAQGWQRHPEWARHRRDEIIARIKSRFQPPEYEYSTDVVSGGRAPLQPSVFATAHPVRRKQSQALVIATVLMLVIAGGMFWLVQSGIREEETYLPSKKGSLRRVVSRQTEPALFWVSIGLYTALGSGTLGFAGWGIGAALRDTGRGRK